MSRIKYGENGNPERRKIENLGAGNRNANDYRRKTDRGEVVQENHQQNGYNSNAIGHSEIRARGRKRDPGKQPPPLDADEYGKNFG